MNIFTIDVEDWFHINDSTWVLKEKWRSLESRVEQNTAVLLSMLHEHKIQATFFVMGWIAEYFPELVRQMIAEGHEVGYHSYYHMRPIHQTPKSFEDDLVSGLQMLEGVTGQKAQVYRAPNLSLDNSTQYIIPILMKHGIRISSSTKSFRLINRQRVPNKPFLWHTSDNSLLEFPLNRFNLPGYPLVFTGSGYFRLFPLSMTSYLYSKHQYNMGYFHPNDIDAHLPTPKEFGIVRNWLNTVGSSTTIGKLNTLLQRHAFTGLSQAASKIDRQTLPYIKIVNEAVKL